MERVGPTGLPYRQAVRGLMIDPRDRVLLVNIRVGGFDGWILPGGGIEVGESEREALVRELTEETGAPDVFMGPPLWRRSTRRPGMGGGRWDGQHNTTYLVPCHAFEPVPAMSPEELAEENVAGVRWWSVEEIDGAGDDQIRPVGLADLVRRVLDHGAPAEPWDLGVIDSRLVGRDRPSGGVSSA